jgi:MSHA biogenesis protein MshJ
MSSQQLMRRIDAMNQRERLMTLIVLIGLIFMLWHTLLMKPVSTRIHQLQNDKNQQAQQVAGIIQSIHAMEKMEVKDPDAENRQKLSSLKSQAQILNDKTQQLTEALISPTAMASALRKMLSSDNKMKLVSLSHSGATPLRSPPPPPLEGQPVVRQNALQQKMSSIYKHSITMTFEGGYLDMLSYLNSLETMPWHLFWETLHFDASDDNVSYITVGVYTISLTQEWIGI